MNDSTLVCGLQRIGNLTSDRQRLLQRESARFDPLGECRPLDQFHYQVAGPDVVNLADVRVIERGDCTNLALEAVSVSLRRDFDRDFAAHPGIAGAVDLTHAPSTERCEDLVWPEARSGTKWHTN